MRRRPLSHRRVVGAGPALVGTLLLSFGLAGPAWAQSESVVRQADRTVYKKRTVIDFTDMTIQGELTKPEGSYLLNRKRTRFKSLLKARANFTPELRLSTDHL